MKHLCRSIRHPAALLLSCRPFRACCDCENRFAKHIKIILFVHSWRRTTNKEQKN